MSKSLEVHNLTVTYGSIEAIREVSFRVERGSIATIIGANGAGKTTVLNAICGLRNIRSGTVELDGANIGSLKPHERVRLGMCHVPEGRRLFSRMTVRENLEIGSYGRADHTNLKRDMEHVLELFPRLAERYTQLAGTLSGGEQQMVAMGRAMMGSPQILLLDEPTMGLAPQLVETVLESIERINREGITILLVEQNAHRALEIAQRSFVLESGEIALVGIGPELLDHPRVRTAYLGFDG